ncbi:HAD family hydrolase [Geothrix fuzhouensis]|uniref:HAD family hydrolase n=1 Tax=Geothrix fuzhouensis TaxID=2966451 RepID=UPI002147D026|nr:HAD family hydrolase [Geothrix fuzhouensis]
MRPTLAFDADDTLWHNETHYAETQEAFRALLRPFHDDAWIDARLHDTEMRNLRSYGYGIKGFTLSMLETALELTENRLDGAGLRQVLELGKAMLDKPVEPLPGVTEVLAELAETFDLMVITKGDLFDQETKLVKSGLGGHFSKVEIVSEKDEAAYLAVLPAPRHPARRLHDGGQLREVRHPPRAGPGWPGHPHPVPSDLGARGGPQSGGSPLPRARIHPGPARSPRRLVTPSSAMIGGWRIPNLGIRSADTRDLSRQGL